MFERFGEFDSAEEINACAVRMMKDGNKKDIYALASENGIDKGEAEDYIEGYNTELVTVLSAAVGKIEAESKLLKISGVLKDWTDIALQQCMTDKQFCIAVRKKGKELKHCMASLIRFSFENKVHVSDEIVDVTKITHNGREEQMRKPLYLGVPNNAQAKKIIREYYLGQEKP